MYYQAPMSTPSDRRSRKRLATRQGISNAATRLFLERGFDHVTVDEIAAAADVGRMTVFNHFPRKEDMFFDRDEEGREILREPCGSAIPASLRSRRCACSRIGWLRNRALRRFSARSQGFIETIEGSETLKARARAIRDELAQVVAVALSECVGRDPPIPTPIWRPACCWRRGPWPSSRLTGPFDRGEMPRKRKPPFSLSSTREPSA
jgi:AcrR family transcriptional regulator